MTENVLIFVFGCILTVLTALVAYQNTLKDKRTDRMEQKLDTVVTDVATMRGTLMAFDAAEISRLRHRINNAEIAIATQASDLEAIKERCRILHKVT
jgi:low affinity Fe/Cu permease